MFDPKTGIFRSAYVPCEAQGLEAVQIALEQIDLIQRLSATYIKDMVLAVTAQDIISTHRLGLISSLIGVEGGHSVSSSLSVLRQMYKLGARYMTLTHRCDSPWAGSLPTEAIQTATTITSAASAAAVSSQATPSPPIGLTSYGKTIIREMNRLGMMIDLSHSSDVTIRDVLKETRAPIIFSHATARTLCNSTLNVDDDILRAISENGGIIMVSFNAILLTCNNPRGATIQNVVDHINYIRTVAGIQHIGIGAGYDGFDKTPRGLEDVSKYPNLFAELLKDPTWSEEDVRLIAGMNLLRVLRSVEMVRENWKLADITPLEALKPPAPASAAATRRQTQCLPMPS